jgi:hypothetical protein
MQDDALLAEARRRGLIAATPALPDDALMAEARKRGLVAAEDKGPARNVTGVIPSFLSGWTAGVSDYPQAGINWAVDNTLGNVANAIRDDREVKYTSFNDSLADVTKSREQYREESPVLAYGAEIAGGLTSPLFRAKAAYSVPAMVEKGLALVPKLLGKQVPKLVQYGAHGAAAGAVTGAGMSRGEDGGLPTVGDLTGDIGQGFAIGGALGSALPAGVRAVAWGGQKLGSAGQAAVDKLPFRQETVAARKVAENLARDELTPEQIAFNRSMLGPKANLVDAAGTRDPSGVWLGGRNTYRQADALANMPGKTQDLAERVLKPRQADAATDLIGAVDENISRQEFYPRLAQLDASKRATAAPLYRQAYDAFPQLHSPFLANMADDPLIIEAVKEGEKGAARAARARGEKPTSLERPVFEFNEAGDPIVKGNWGLEQWDTVQKGLSRMINNMRDASGRLPKTAEVRDLVDFQRSLKDHLDEVTSRNGVSLFKQARQAWAGPSALEDAMWHGRDFMRGDREVVTAAFKKLSPDERQAFLDGMAREIEGAVEQTGTVPGRLKNILNAESKARKVLEEVLPPDQFKGFMNSVGGIVRRLETARMRTGSDTFARGANADDLGADLGGALIEGVRGNPTNAALGAGRAIWNWIKQPSEGARDEMGRLLLDPAAFDEAIARLQGRARVPRELPQAFQGLLDEAPSRGPAGLLSPMFAPGS